MSPAQILRAYVEAHNGGVRSGDFARLGALLTEDATMRFKGIDAGPFVGRAAILAAFAKSPPRDELVLLTQRGAQATYAWRRRRTRPAGRIRIVVSGDRISAIDVTAGRP
jgi:hypothetical protein